MTPVDCVHNRARLYHVHSRALYHAIGEPGSRYRRPVAARQAVERLILLDAMLDSPDLNWLTTHAEKAAYFMTLTAAKPDGVPPIAPASWPSLSRQELGSTFPIGVNPTGGVVLPYVTTVPWTKAFRRFLQDHVTLLRAVPHWTLRLVFPRPLDRYYDGYRAVIREELETPLPSARISELKWYFAHRQKAADNPPDTLTQAFLKRGSEVFAAPRFTMLYKRWLKHGDATFEAVSSPAIAEALKAGTACVERVVLPHSYRHLSPLVNPIRATSRGVEKAEERGEDASARPQPPSLTPFSPVVSSPVS